MLFSLPLEVREVVYRKARYLAARQRLAERMAAEAARHRVVFGDHVHKCIIPLLSDPDKTMTITRFFDYPDTLVVSVDKYERCAMSLFVDEEGCRVRLCMMICGRSEKSVVSSSVKTERCSLIVFLQH